MKILIEIDDEFIGQYSEDVNDTDYTRAVKYDLSWIEIALTPTYRDGHQIMWLETWIEPGKPRPEFSATIIEDVKP